MYEYTRLVIVVSDWRVEEEGPSFFLFLFSVEVEVEFKRVVVVVLRCISTKV